MCVALAGLELTLDQAGLELSDYLFAFQVLELKLSTTMPSPTFINNFLNKNLQQTSMHKRYKLFY